MLFPTVEFAVFFLCIFLCSWALYGIPVLRKLVLLAASYYFYAYWEWRYAALLLEVSIADFVLGIAIDRAASKQVKRAWLAIGIIANLAVLCYFKYWGFFLSQISASLSALGYKDAIRVVDVILPVGISFFTFQGISYLVDIYRGQMRATKSLLDFLLYPAFFPHLVAGPIVRAADILPQFAKPANPMDIKASYAFLLLGMGVFKKVFIAHYLAVELVNPVFEAPSSYGSLDLVLAAYGYAVQIYCDFSAYSDMAIGLSALLGIRFKPNFDQPYRAASLSEFWRRWHISLSQWLRDYLYISLGGNRRGRLLTYRNLLLTMVLGGLWHGAAWNFVIWGGLHGLGLAVERLGKDSLKLPEFGLLGRMVRTFVVFNFVCLTWIFFNAETLDLALEYLTALSNFSEAPRALTPLSLSLLVLGIGFHFIPKSLLPWLVDRLLRIPLIFQSGALAAWILAISALGPGALAPFIYFRF